MIFGGVRVITFSAVIDNDAPSFQAEDFSRRTHTDPADALTQGGGSPGAREED